MLRTVKPIYDEEYGGPVSDDRLPLIRLREKRRELVMALAGSRLTSQAIHEIAAVHVAIKAVEAVLAE
jgi:hypothetical protein